MFKNGIFKSSYDNIKEFFFTDANNHILWLIAVYACGCIIYFSLSFEPNIYSLSYIFIALLICTVLFRNHYLLFCIVCILSSLFAGMLVSSIRTQSLSCEKLSISLDRVKVSGKITKIYPLEKGHRTLLNSAYVYSIGKSQQDDKKQKSYFKNIQLSIKTNIGNLKVGDIVSVYASLHPPSRPLFPEKYDFARHSYFNEIGAIGFAVSNIKIIKTHTNRKYNIYDFIERMRGVIFEKITHDKSNENSKIAAALMIGEQRSINDNILLNMRNSGLVHVLSVSGMHLSIVSIICFFIIRYFLSFSVFIAEKYNTKKIAAYVSLFVTFFYLLISGMQIAAFRSFIMVAFVIVAVIIDRAADAKRSVCFAAFFILIFMPESIFHPGFQMSFSAVLILVSLYEFYKNKFMVSVSVKTIRKILNYGIGIILSSFFAGCATSIFVIYHFGNYSNYSILANLLVAPVVSFIIMPFVVITFILLPFDSLYKLSLQCLNAGIEIMLWVADFTAKLPNSSIWFPPVSGVVPMLFIIGLLWLCIWQAKWRFAGVIPIIASVVVLYHFEFPSIIIDAKYNAVLIKKNKELLKIGGKNMLSRWHKDQIYRVANVNSINIKSHSNTQAEYIFTYPKHDILIKLIDLPKVNIAAKTQKTFNDLTILNAETKEKVISISYQDLEKHGSYFIFLNSSGGVSYKYSVDGTMRRPWRI